VRPSIVSVGDAYDDAMCESFLATLECKLLERRRFASQSEAKNGLLQLYRKLIQSRSAALRVGIPLADGIRSDDEGRHQAKAKSHSTRSQRRLRSQLEGCAGALSMTARSGVSAGLPGRDLVATDRRNDAAAGTACARARHRRRHPCLANVALGTVRKILARNDVKPHKVRSTSSDATPRSRRKWQRCSASIARLRFWVQANPWLPMWQSFRTTRASDRQHRSRSAAEARGT
jgi:hypothetical protein